MDLTRRYFLQTTAAAVGYAAFAPARFLSAAGLSVGDVKTVRRDKTLVVIFLRGGMDGLNFLVPYGDPAYAGLRKNIAVARPGEPAGAVDLDGFFGLHPRAAALAPWFQQGVAVGLQAVGYDRNTRSHFEEQDTWETGVAGTGLTTDGWLNRHLMTSEGRGPIRAVSIGDSLPRILRGPAPAFAVRGITDLSLFPGKKEGEADTAAQTRLASALEKAYGSCCDPRVHAAAAQAARQLAAESPAKARSLLGQTANATFEGIAELKAVVNQPYQPAADYPPNNELAKRLQQVARIIKAGIGLEVAEIDYGGWDTHQNQGNVSAANDGGAFGKLVGGLADALAAFARDLEDRLDDVLVLTLSDFGRTAAENGTGGTDHGWANCMVALGGPVRAAGNGQAREVLGQWPGLGPEQLHQKRDLLHTTDFRDVLGEVVANHLGNRQLATVLPGRECQRVGLL